jgi:hypothetical protein
MSVARAQTPPQRGCQLVNGEIHQRHEVWPVITGLTVFASNHPTASASSSKVRAVWQNLGLQKQEVFVSLAKHSLVMRIAKHVRKCFFEIRGLHLESKITRLWVHLHASAAGIISRPSLMSTISQEARTCSLILSDLVTNPI